MIFRISIILLMSLTFLQPLPAVQPEDIIYMTEDYPPENYLDNGRLKGYAVEILKAMWKKMGVPEQEIKVLPWARGYDMALKQPNHMLFSMARNPERENLFKWVGPIYHADAELFSLAEKSIKINNINDAKKFRIGVIRNDIGETLLKEAGFPDSSFSKVKSLKQLIMMLKTGRIDMISTNEASLKNEIKRDKSLSIRYKSVWFVGKISVYYAFSRSTEDEIVNRFQKALASINEQRKSIIRKYNLSE